jgi:hypothetical protein
MSLLSLVDSCELFACAAAVGAAFTAAAAVASAFREAATEATSDGDAGAVSVAATGDRSVSSAAGYAAESVASPAAVVVVIGDEDWEEAAMAIGALLLDALLVRREAGAEFVVYDVVVLVDATLHLGFPAPCEHGESGCCEEWGCDLGGASHDFPCGDRLAGARVESDTFAHGTLCEGAKLERPKIKFKKLAYF